MSTAAPPVRPSRADRFLGAVERVGNRLPEPFTLFLILFLAIALVSTFMALADVTVQVPGAEEVTEIQGLFTPEGLTWFTENIGVNYIGFPPLTTVLTIWLAVGVAEKTGLLAAGVRAVFGSAPRWALPYAVGLVGVGGSVMSDSAFIVIPPLAAMVFKAAGRHPVAGLLGGFAAAGAGYSTNFAVTSLDALFAGITVSVTQILPNPGDPVNPVSNWYFNVVSAFLLSVLAGFLIDKVLEPRLVRQGVAVDEARFTGTVVPNAGRTTPGAHAEGEPVGAVESADLSAIERRGLQFAVGALLLVAAVLAVAFLVPGSPWRNEDGGFLPESPLLSSITFVIFVLFLVPGVVYGVVTRAITSMKDIPRLLEQSIKDMAGFLVLAFVLGQFIALFNWSGVGQWIAVAGAEGLESSGLTGYGAIIGFLVLASLLNLFIISGSSLWTIMAAVFVPMFALIGYEPGFVQAAFRVGDSATQIITPLNPYMIVLLTFLRRWEPGAGLGTVMARLLPFTVAFWLVWAAVLSVFFFADLPVGPGNGIFLE
ncbi:AbgT family transporter [Promicromonospora iranensis]|uniref:Aminobenzoyl-glutamate transport protein n=1 Tax=Promicromonospora iranensis TaxID=1105144 RepID=A0ABU2CQ46_9MICO|nr:AbgT family transporter [Promicromonospora iranensis]MDR7383466.1 aminobenzoyl-glutamate transport protein [Promicromonospora iranensis]